MDPEKLEEKILSALLNILGVPPDPKAQYEFLTDPPNIQTMTYLNPSQVNFVTIAEWCALDNPVEMQGLGRWSTELMQTMKSEKGRGIEALIRYEQSKRAPPSSSVNILGSLKEQAGKVSKKIKGDQEE